MLYFKKIKMTLNYKNEKTLYVIFFYMIVFAYMLYFELFKNDFNLCLIRLKKGQFWYYEKYYTIGTTQ